MKMKIKSLEHLKEVAIRPDDCDRTGFSIRLNYGAVSSKDIGYYPEDDCWDVFHSISGSIEDYDSTEDFIKHESFIIEAINQGALHHLKGE
jgi:hypothetical protein